MISKEEIKFYSDVYNNIDKLTKNNRNLKCSIMINIHETISSAEDEESKKLSELLFNDIEIISREMIEEAPDSKNKAIFASLLDLVKENISYDEALENIKEYDIELYEEVKNISDEDVEKFFQEKQKEFITEEQERKNKEWLL